MMLFDLIHVKGKARFVSNSLLTYVLVNTIVQWSIEITETLHAPKK